MAVLFCPASESKTSHQIVVMGLDPSLVSTGVAVVDPQGRPVHHEAVGSPAGLDPPQRILAIADRVLALAALHLPAVTVMEGLAMGGVQGSSYLDLAGLHHHIRCVLIERLPLVGHGVKVVPPASLKKFVGSGRLKKDEMRLAVFKRWGVEFPTSDEVDAYALAQWGLAFLRGQVDLEPGRQKGRAGKGGRR